MDKPKVGQIVLATVEPSMNNGNDVAPAIITRVGWGEYDGYWVVNLRVFADASTIPLSVTSAAFHPDEAGARTHSLAPGACWPIPGADEY